MTIYKIMKIDIDSNVTNIDHNKHINLYSSKLMEIQLYTMTQYKTITKQVIISIICTTDNIQAKMRFGI